MSRRPPHTNIAVPSELFDDAKEYIKQHPLHDEYGLISVPNASSVGPNAIQTLVYHQTERTFLLLAQPDETLDDPDMKAVLGSCRQVTSTDELASYIEAEADRGG